MNVIAWIAPSRLCFLQSMLTYSTTRATFCFKPQMVRTHGARSVPTSQDKIRALRKALETRRHLMPMVKNNAELFTPSRPHITTPIRSGPAPTTEGFGYPPRPEKHGRKPNPQSYPFEPSEPG